MQTSHSITSAIDSNKQLFNKLSKTGVSSNKTQLLQAYESDKITYYNDENAIKKQNRKKVAKWLTLGFAAITILSTISAIAVQIARKKINLNDINNAVSGAKQNADKMSNRMVNFDICKNDGWQAFSNFISEKTPFKINKWFDKPISEKYRNIATSKNMVKHAESRAIITPHLKELGIKETTFNYKSASKEIYNAIEETLSKKENKTTHVLIEAFEEGFKKQTEGESIFKRLVRGFSNFWDVSGKSVITDDKLKDIYQMTTQGLSQEHLPEGVSLELFLQAASDDTKIADSARKKMIDIIAAKLPDSLDENPSNYLDKQLDMRVIKELCDKALKKGTQEAKDVYDGITMHTEDFSNHYNETLAEKITDALIDLHKIETKNLCEQNAKMRDIATGDASFEVVSMIGAVGASGAAVISENDKEKRKSKVINLVIPLLSTLGFSIFGSYINLDKKISTPLGLIIGTGISKCAKAIDNALNKNKQKENIQA